MSKVGSTPINVVTPGIPSPAGSTPISIPHGEAPGESGDAGSAGSELFVYGVYDRMGRPSGRRSVILNDTIVTSGQ